MACPYPLPSTTPLPEPMQNCYLDPYKHTSVQFESKYKSFPKDALTMSSAKCQPFCSCSDVLWQTLLAQWDGDMQLHGKHCGHFGCPWLRILVCGNVFEKDIVAIPADMITLIFIIVITSISTYCNCYHCCLVTHICVTELGHHCLSWWLVTCWTPNQPNTFLPFRKMYLIKSPANI